MRACLANATIDLGLGDALHLEREAHVPRRGHVRIQRVVLEDHGDVAVLRGEVVHDLTVDLHVPGRDRLEAGDHPQRRRLSAAGRADEDDELARLDLEVEIGDGLRAVGIDLRQLLEGDLRHVKPPAANLLASAPRMEAKAVRARPAPGRMRHALESRRVLAPLLIAPAVIFMALVVGVPFVWAIYLSFTNAIGGSLSGDWVGFDNFTSAWQDENFRRALRNTFIFTLASQAIVLVGAAVLSNFLVRDFRGRWIVRFLVVLPWAAPVVLSTIAWLWLLDSLYSVVNWTLARLHLDEGLVSLLAAVNIEEEAQVPLQWLGRPNLALIAITLVHAWRILPSPS